MKCTFWSVTVLAAAKRIIVLYFHLTQSDKVQSGVAVLWFRKFTITRDTPFSVDYDLPKEISVARKALWSELKALKTNNPRVKCQIIYPAKLVVDGKVVRDEFPDWYSYERQRAE